MFVHAAAFHPNLVAYIGKVDDLAVTNTNNEATETVFEADTTAHQTTDVETRGLPSLMSNYDSCSAIPFKPGKSTTNPWTAAAIFKELNALNPTTNDNGHNAIDGSSTPIQIATRSIAFDNSQARLPRQCMHSQRRNDESPALTWAGDTLTCP
ncbi:MAG: hypothetical protein JJ878_13710 [Alphaproteobacteria bacterium]|nr:hypothetical protein [Alphaproteobacteria bacterium]MBO6863689.1 hypothetical protein [Alphaproteobacteria bacterium]